MTNTSGNRSIAFSRRNSQITYGYNGLNQRVSKAGGGVDITYIHSPSGRLLAEYNSAQSWIYSFERHVNA